MADYEYIRCYDCGIVFGIETGIYDTWKQNQKSFHCPNGHKNYIINKEAKEAVVVGLRAEVKELKEKLDGALLLVADKNQTIEKLNFELEIWRPTTRE